jgi:hypothetical protein
MKQVYKITYPTARIYVGKDSVGSARYMGSPDMNLVNADFARLPPGHRRDYTVRKEILWESETATEAELSAKELEWIRQLRSNDPAVGYNRWPRFDRNQGAACPGQPDLAELVGHVLDACIAIDSSGLPFKAFQPGVGPYGEPQLVKGITHYINKVASFEGRAASKRTPDLLIHGLWALEFKIARPFGDNGNEAENWSVNLLHPYAGNASVFGDALKLNAWNGPERRAAVVIGYEHDPPQISLTPLFDAFDALATRLLPFQISPRVEAAHRGLKHPVHRVVRVVAWEVPRIATCP